MARPSRRLFPILGIPLLAACGILGIGDDDGQGLRDHPTLVASIQSDGVVRLDARDASVIATYDVPGTDGVGNYIQDPTLMPSDEAIIGGGGRDPEPTTIYFSVDEFRALWHLPARELEEASAGIDLRASFKLASPNGREILYGPSNLGTQRGIAALDPETRVARMLHEGTLHPSAVAGLPPSDYAPRGAVLVHAGREGRYELGYPTALYVLDAEDGSVLDSIPAEELPEAENLDRLVSGFDGTRLLIWAGTGFHLYDLEARATVGWVPAASWYNRTAFDPRADQFAIYDAGGIGYPGTGIVQLFDEELRRTDIDLREVPSEGPYPPSVRGVAFGENGLVYILTGNSGVSAYPWQPVRVIVADGETGALISTYQPPLEGNPVGLFYSPAQR